MHCFKILCEFMEFKNRVHSWSSAPLNNPRKKDILAHEQVMSLVIIGAVKSTQWVMMNNHQHVISRLSLHIFMVIYN